MTHEFTAFILLWFHIWSGWLTDEYSLDDHDDQESQRILAELENIDDECDQKGVAFVKIDDDSVAREYGVDSLPSLVYFENKIPSLYHGDLANEEQVLAWLMEQLASDTIEDITDEMLDKLIKKSTHLAVLFCKSIKLSIFFQQNGWNSTIWPANYGCFPIRSSLFSNVWCIASDREVI